jgi:hypothetical protein
MLTRNTGVFRCSEALAERVANEAGLKEERVRNCRFWQDRATGGGGCRIAYKDEYVWVSRHSGYPQADITEEVAEFFVMYGAEMADGMFSIANPYIYPEDYETRIEFAKNNPER